MMKSSKRSVKSIGICALTLSFFALGTSTANAEEKPNLEKEYVPVETGIVSVDLTNVEVESKEVTFESSEEDKLTEKLLESLSKSSDNAEIVAGEISVTSAPVETETTSVAETTLINTDLTTNSVENKELSKDRIDETAEEFKATYVENIDFGDDFIKLLEDDSKRTGVEISYNTIQTVLSKFNSLEEVNFSTLTDAEKIVAETIINKGYPYSRVTDFTQDKYSSIGLVRARFKREGTTYLSHGSGGFIASNIFVTAAHVVVDKGNPVESATVYLKHNQVFRTQGYGGTTELTQPNTKFEFYNLEEYKKSIGVDDEGNDLAIIIFDNPVQFTDPNTTTFRLSDSRTIRIGDTLHLAGYPSNSTHGLAYSVSSPVTAITASDMVHYLGDTEGGHSGSVLYGDNGLAVGIHTFGAKLTNGGILFSDKHYSWLNSMIDQHAVKGWKDNSGSRYYFDNKGQMVKGQYTIDGTIHEFDSKTGKWLREVSPVKTGIVMAKFVDADGGSELKAPVEVINGGYGTSYTVTPSEIQYFDFVGARAGSNLTGTIDADAKDVVLTYRRKTVNVPVEYVGPSGVLGTDTINVKMGIAQTINAKDFHGVSANEPSKSVTITTTNPDKVVFNYSPIFVNVPVEYVGPTGLLGSETITVNIGKPYTFKAKDFDNFEPTESTKTVMFNHTDAQKIVFNYLVKTTTHTVNHILQDDNRSLSSDSVTINRGEKLPVFDKLSNRDYVYVSSKSNTTDLGDTNLTYLYTYATVNVTVKGVDNNGKEIYNDTISGKVKSSQTVNAKNVARYNLSGSEGGSRTITFTHDMQPIVFNYLPDVVKVTVTAYDEFGNKLYGTTDDVKYGSDLDLNTFGRPTNFDNSIYSPVGFDNIVKVGGDLNRTITYLTKRANFRVRGIDQKGYVISNYTLSNAYNHNFNLEPLPIEGYTFNKVVSGALKGVVNKDKFEIVLQYNRNEVPKAPFVSPVITEPKVDVPVKNPAIVISFGNKIERKPVRPVEKPTTTYPIWGTIDLTNKTIKDIFPNVKTVNVTTPKTPVVTKNPVNTVKPAISTTKTIGFGDNKSVNLNGGTKVDNSVKPVFSKNFVDRLLELFKRFDLSLKSKTGVSSKEVRSKWN